MMSDVEVMKPPCSTTVPKRSRKSHEFKCDVCDARFSEKWKIKFHIRRKHFNLYARVPHAEQKQVNQVWVERVLNTDQLMEIKKTSGSRLVMKPTRPHADLRVHNNNRRVDLRSVYPVERSPINDQCRICGKVMRKYDMKKHLDERHFNVRKHKCNNCNMSFKRSYIFLQHVCHKNSNRKGRVTGVRHDNRSSIRISNVETLKHID